jgi:hypothetical protein
MTYKNKLIFLLSLIAVLVLLYTGSLVFNSDLFSAQTSFAWIDARAAGSTTRIVVKTFRDDFELVRQNNHWFVLEDGFVYPARQARIQDFLNIVSSRAAWQIRSTSPSTHERFGLDDRASRVTLYAENAMLLDLLVGEDDFVRRETYYRIYDQNEVRSGDSSIKIYISMVHPWYNLRIIPETDYGQLDVINVQRLSVYTPYETQIFTRRNREWVISGSIHVENPDLFAIENYIRTILNTEGDNFVQAGLNDPDFFNEDTDSRIVIEFGNGVMYDIRFSEADETGRRFAFARGTGTTYNDYSYIIPSWSASRLFRDAESFEF